VRALSFGALSPAIANARAVMGKAIIFASDNQEQTIKK
jgi:hypothetical protein